MSNKKNERKQNHPVNPDEELLREYVKMQMMVYNYRLFIFNYALKINPPELPDIDTIQKTCKDILLLNLQFQYLVEDATLAAELEGYLLEKSDFMKNEIEEILMKLAEAKGFENSEIYNWKF
jgi:hypothetical protein